MFGDISHLREHDMSKGFGIDASGRPLKAGDTFHWIHGREFNNQRKYGVMANHMVSGLFQDSTRRPMLYKQVRKVDVDSSSCGMSFAELMACFGHSEYTKP